jgi:hypothetical protein
VVIDPEGAKSKRILDAARACPTHAITLINEAGEQVWPGHDRRGRQSLAGPVGDPAPHPSPPGYAPQSTSRTTRRTSALGITTWGC